MTDKFKKIDDLIEVLDNLYNLSDKTLTNLQPLDELIASKAQETVDDVCIRLSDKINSELSIKRADLVNCLHNQYSTSQEIVTKFSPVATAINNLSLPTKLDDVISILTDTINSLKNFAELFLGPYKEAIEFTIQLTPKLIELSKQIDKISKLPSKIPPIPNQPNLNYDKLKIKVDPITLDEIKTGNRTSN